MADNTQTAYRGLARVAFLARREDFQRLLDAGYPLRVIYEEHKAQLGIGYPQFTRYVGRYLRKPTYARQQTRDGSGRVAFLARREDFQRLLDAGHSLRAIYEEHKAQLGIGYPQFTKYVSRYLQKADHDRPQTRDGSGAPAPAASANVPPPSTPQPAPAPPPEPGDKPAARPTSKPQKPFVWDPMAAHTREDLI
jgi:hypothetical protein